MESTLRGRGTETDLMLKRIHYAWRIAGTTFAVLLVSAAIRATPGVLTVPLERELGWSRATISLAVSVNLLLYGLMGPFGAAIAEKVGIRRTIEAERLPHRSRAPLFESIVHGAPPLATSRSDPTARASSASASARSSWSGS